MKLQRNAGTDHAEMIRRRLRIEAGFIFAVGQVEVFHILGGVVFAVDGPAGGFVGGGCEECHFAVFQFFRGKVIR